MNGPWTGRYLRRWNRNTLVARQLLTNDGSSRGSKCAEAEAETDAGRSLCVPASNIVRAHVCTGVCACTCARRPMDIWIAVRIPFGEGRTGAHD